MPLPALVRSEPSFPVIQFTSHDQPNPRNRIHIFSLNFLEKQKEKKKKPSEFRFTITIRIRVRCSLISIDFLRRSFRDEGPLCEDQGRHQAFTSISLTLRSLPTNRGSILRPLPLVLLSSRKD